MTQIIVCSDNHGKTKELDLILEKYESADGFIHCGDSEFDPSMLNSFHAVRGNNDYYDFPDDRVVEINGIRIYVTHGHLMGYRSMKEEIALRAKSHNCAIACFGHTHIPFVETIDEVLLINPGSINYNRDGSPTSFALLSINGDVKDAKILTTNSLYLK